MKEQFLQYAACPSCRGRLGLGGGRVDGVSGEIRSGTLECQACRASYPIRNYIPRFVSSDNYASSFGLEWSRHRSTQLDSSSGMTISRDRFYRATQWPERMEGQRILEVGCGAGRFTEVALRAGAELVSFDLSEAVDACLENHGLAPSWHLFQGDLHRLPLREALFDGVFCLGVLQHCPSPQAALDALLTALRPGGRLSVDVYEQNWKVYATPRFWLRMMLRRLHPQRTYRWIEGAVPRLLPLKTWLKRRVPAGRFLAAMVPVVSYEDSLYEGVGALPPEQMLEWTILDTFDALTPWHEHRLSRTAVEGWLARARLTDTSVDTLDGFVVARGVKPVASVHPHGQ